MKQQVIVIHGGTTFETNEDYLSYLETQEVSLERLRPQKSWKDSLQENLGENFLAINSQRGDTLVYYLQN